MVDTASTNNVVVIILDTVRARSTSVAGRDITPTLSSVAEDGLTFEHAITPAPWTFPAHASILTGLYPTAHGATQMSRKMPETHDTLAERLSECGLETALFSASGFLTETYGMTQGFDENTFIREKTDRIFKKGIKPTEVMQSNKEGWTYRDLLWTALSGPAVRNLSNLAYYKLLKRWRTIKYNTKNPHGRWDDKVAQRTNSYIRDRAESSEDFFVMVNLIEAHAPWQFDLEMVEAIDVNPEQIAPLERWERVAEWSGNKWGYATGEVTFDDTDRKILTRLYESWIHRVDSVASSIIRTLNKEGLRDETLLILTSDHGEIIAEEGDLGHTTSVSEDVARVPLVIDGPRINPGNVADIVSLKHIYGTVLNEVGAAADAVSLLEETARGEALIETRGPHERIAADRRESAPHLWGTKRALYTDDGWVERRYRQNEVRGDTILLERLDSLVKSLERSQCDYESEEVDPADSEVSDRLEDLGYLG